MAGLVHEVPLQTGTRILPFPIWETKWDKPETFSTPTILLTNAWEGIIICQS